MIPVLNSNLPFPRGKTAADGVITPTLAWAMGQSFLGFGYLTSDTVYGYASPVVLLPVVNTTSGAITVARKFAEFDISAAGRRPVAVGTFPCDTAGAVALPLDDAYPVGSSIPQYDIFYLVAYGRCKVLTGAAVNALTAGGTVATDNAGLIANVANAAAGSFVIGFLEYASSYSASTATMIFVDPANLCLPDAAG